MHCVSNKCNFMIHAIIPCRELLTCRAETSWWSAIFMHFFLRFIFTINSQINRLLKASRGPLNLALILWTFQTVYIWNFGSCKQHSFVTYMTQICKIQTPCFLTEGYCVPTDSPKGREEFTATQWPTHGYTITQDKASRWDAVAV